MARGDAHGMPKEVFIVDIKKGPAGLGVGLVDGMSTALSQSGVYVRSLIPDDQTRKVNLTTFNCLLIETFI